MASIDNPFKRFNSLGIKHAHSLLKTSFGANLRGKHSEDFYFLNFMDFFQQHANFVLELVYIFED